MPRTDVRITSLTAATDIDVLPDAAIIEDRGDYVVVRTPANPVHFWGNFLLWRDAPAVGDRERWEAAFEAEFADQPGSTHRSFAWDRTDGERGAADEFLAAGYEGDAAVALIAQPHELLCHPRASEMVAVQVLDPAPGADEQRWRAVVELQVAARETGHSEAEYRSFVEARMADRRARFARGDGAWFVAMSADGEVVGSCGVMVTDGRARYQAVDTAASHRRQGVATRLVYEAGRAAVDRLGARVLVIVADADYHALELYESLGFVPRQRTFAVCWWPGAPHAARHPTRGHLARPVR